MNINRIFTLVKKEFLFGSKNFIFIMAVVMPVVLTLVISLLVGTLFSGKPRLGIVDQGHSQLTAKLDQLDYLTTELYPSAELLHTEVERGALDMGLVLPADFDRRLQAEAETGMDLLIWGESLLKHRTILAVSLVRQIIDVAGREIPVNTALVLLGEEANILWDVRLFPFVVIITILLGGMMVPATSLVEEKVKRTYRALLITPASLRDILTAKGLTGVILALFEGLLILSINRAFGSQPATLIAVMIISGIFAAATGIILGVLVKDISTLFTVIKSLGIFLYAPAFVFMFPEIPQWIAQIFPTYYLLNPIIELTMNNATWADIATDVYILIGLTIALIGVAGFLARRALDADA
ncbi:putative multidrug ABC transporter permease YbhR [Thermoflexales bacterium]|nr:putative multidrug ABC transporter permease YbhR [Thermoflexales bacterium]